MPQLSHKARKRWAIVLLTVGLPIYIVLVMNVMVLFDRPHFLVEFGIYLAFGVLWALPLKFIFRGVGRDDPDAPRG